MQRLKFKKPIFVGDRSWNEGEVGDIPDNVAAELIKDGFAVATEDPVTDFTVPAADTPADPPADPKKKK